MKFADKRLWTEFGISHSGGGGCNYGAKEYTKKSKREREIERERLRERD